MFEKLARLFGKKAPATPDLELLIEEALQRYAPTVNRQAAQLSQLEAQFERVNGEVQQLRAQNQRLTDEAAAQTEQLRRFYDTLQGLPSQVQNLAQTLASLSHASETLPQDIDGLRQGFLRIEEELYSLQRVQGGELDNLSQQLSQVRTEIPDQAQISALVEQLAWVQMDLGKWQRTFSEELAQLKIAPPAVVAPKIPAGKFEDYFNAGKILLLSGEGFQALQSLDQALQLNDQSAEAWYYRAVALGQANQVEACLTSLERAFALDPNRKSLDLEVDFPTLWNNERFNQLLGRPGAGEVEEAIDLPQVDLANLFDL